jgi:rifampin ADP-ribosylating transferase
VHASRSGSSELAAHVLAISRRRKPLSAPRRPCCSIDGRDRGTDSTLHPETIFAPDVGHLRSRKAEAIARPASWAPGCGDAVPMQCVEIAGACVAAAPADAFIRIGTVSVMVGACMAGEPTPFEIDRSGRLSHGTKADLRVGDLLEPGRRSNYGEERTANHIYVTATLDAATWGAELAMGDGRGRIYVVEPIGALEDDPNVTDRRFPGNPTRSYRTRGPVRIIGEVLDWVGHSPEKLRAMRARVDERMRTGTAEIDD